MPKQLHPTEVPPKGQRFRSLLQDWTCKLPGPSQASASHHVTGSWLSCWRMARWHKEDPQPLPRKGRRDAWLRAVGNVFDRKVFDWNPGQQLINEECDELIPKCVTLRFVKDLTDLLSSISNGLFFGHHLMHTVSHHWIWWPKNSSGKEVPEQSDEVGFKHFRFHSNHFDLP